MGVVLDEDIRKPVPPPIYRAWMAWMKKNRCIMEFKRARNMELKERGVPRIQTGHVNFGLIRYYVEKHAGLELIAGQLPEPPGIEVLWPKAEDAKKQESVEPPRVLGITEDGLLNLDMQEDLMWGYHRLALDPDSVESPPGRPNAKWFQKELYDNPEARKIYLPLILKAEQARNDATEKAMRDDHGPVDDVLNRACEEAGVTA